MPAIAPSTSTDLIEGKTPGGCGFGVRGGSGFIATGRCLRDEFCRLLPLLLPKRDLRIFGRLLLSAKLLFYFAPLPGYVSNHVPCPRASVSKGFGGNQSLGLRADVADCSGVSKGEGTVTLAKPRQLRNHAPEGIAQPSNMATPKSYAVLIIIERRVVSQKCFFDTFWKGSASFFGA